VHIGRFASHRYEWCSIVGFSPPTVLPQRYSHAAWLNNSLYITHSRHDINAFLGGIPDLAYSSLDAIYKDGKYHKNLDLIKDIMTGPAKPEDDPDYYRKLAARDAFQRTVVNLIAGNRLDGICFPCCQVLPPTRQKLNDGRWTVLTFPTNTR
jgi:amidase